MLVLYFDIGSRMTICLAGYLSSSGDVAEDFAPSSLIVQVFLEIVVMVVGVEEMLV